VNAPQPCSSLVLLDRENSSDSRSCGRCGAPASVQVGRAGPVWRTAGGRPRIRGRFGVSGGQPAGSPLRSGSVHPSGAGVHRLVPSCGSIGSRTTAERDVGRDGRATRDEDRCPTRSIGWASVPPTRWKSGFPSRCVRDVAVTRTPGDRPSGVGGRTPSGPRDQATGGRSWRADMRAVPLVGSRPTRSGPDARSGAQEAGHRPAVPAWCAPGPQQNGRRLPQPRARCLMRAVSSWTCS
jgi:hypothetical protein